MRSTLLEGTVRNGRSGVPCMALVMTIIALMAAAQASSQELAANRRTAVDDPAVMAFTTFVVGKDLAYPADRAIVVAAFDRLACAIEGLALARNAFGDADFADVHNLRREIRELAISADTPALTKGAPTRSSQSHNFSAILIALHRAVQR